MKVTVCEMNDDPALFEKDWEGLVAHVRANAQRPRFAQRTAVCELVRRHA